MSTSTNIRQQRQSLSGIRAERVVRMRRANDAAKTKCDEASSKSKLEEGASEAAFTRECHRIQVGSTKNLSYTHADPDLCNPPDAGTGTCATCKATDSDLLPRQVKRGRPLHRGDAVYA